MEKKNFIKAQVEVKRSGDRITVIASDETLDRHGDVLSIDAWDLSKFLTAPRMLIDHDHRVEKIVGRWDNVRIEGKKLLMDANFHEITELSKAVKEMVESDFLNTVSVGFIMHGPDKDGGSDTFELIETSWVTVPANPSARVMKAFEMEATTEEKQKLEKFLDEDPEELEDSDEALPEDDEEPLPEEETLDEEKPEKVETEEDEDEEGLDEEKSIASVEDFTEFIDKGGEEVCVCSVDFIKTLIEHSEKLKTLTNEREATVEAERRAKLIREATKEAARHINHVLRGFNKVDDL